MSPQDLTNAIVSGINAGGEQFLEGTLAAVLPIVWLAILGLHLGRPYIRAYRWTSILLALGGLFYFVPYLLGVQANSVATGSLLSISQFLVTNSNPNWAVGIGYLSIVLLAIMGAFAAGYVIRTGGRAEAPDASPASED